MISGSSRGVRVNFVLLGCYTALLKYLVTDVSGRSIGHILLKLLNPSRRDRKAMQNRQ
jgi:hypothetical protein